MVLAILALAAVSAAARAAPPPATPQIRLSPPERRIVREVEARAAHALALLEQVVAINSGTMNLDGVREVGRVLGAELERLDFATRWLDGGEFGRAGHLVAERPGRGPHLLLIGHLDTVFEADSRFQRFEPIAGGRARGPGVIDMKGGDVILIEALAALRAARVLDRLRVTVVLTGDEESMGKPAALARRALREAAAAADIAIGFENADNDPGTAVVARRGATRWRLEVRGKPGHSSQVFRPGAGAGAIFEAARVLDRFRQDLAGEPYLTFNPGVMLGGSTADLEAGTARGSASGKANVIAATALVEGDLRTLTPEQLERAKARMEAIVAASLPETSATIAFDDGYPPLAPSDGNRRLLAALDRASADLGLGPVTAVDPAAAGAADVSFTAGLVEMAIDGLGLLGSGEHTTEETADLATLPVQMKRTALLLYRLSRGEALTPGARSVKQSR